MRLRVLLLLALFACAPGDRSGSAAAGDTGGTVIIAMPAEPQTLLPPLVRLTQEKQVIDQIFDVLAEIGPGLNTFGDAGFTPRLARSWTWSADSLTIAFHIDPRARWHDGRPVSAGDVRFSLELYQDPVVGSHLADVLSVVDSVSVPDSLTAVAWFARRGPEQFYAVAHNLTILPEHLLRGADRTNLRESAFSRNPVGSGPFRFVRWEARSAIELAADTAWYLGRPRLDRLIWTLGGGLATALSNVIVGDADVLETLTPDAMAQVSASQIARPVAFPGMTYGYLGFNLWDPRDPSRPHSLFSDRDVRVAISMALDRQAMLSNVFDSLAYPAFGPFTRTIPTSDTTIVPFAHDSAGAARLLASAGWRDTDGDGIRDRSGRPLRFGLLVPAQSAPRRQYAELVQALLRPHGVQVDVEAVDAQFGPRLLSGQFDAVINAWLIDPAPSAIKGTWYSRPSTQRGMNLQGYGNLAFDASLDSAAAEVNPARARELYRRAYRVLVADAPAVWLYESRTFVAVNRRVRTAGDSADTWWRFLRLWWIPGDERISRDLPPSATSR
ncbi:MAG TPA: ABC transporter substrate-binding protein [Gemmatimonadaceae bacterium]